MSSTKKASSSAESYDELKEKRAWDVALAPVKSLPMQAFMLYMSGGGVQIFSIGIVFMLLLTPFKNIAGINGGKQSNFIGTNSSELTNLAQLSHNMCLQRRALTQ